MSSYNNRLSQPIALHQRRPHGKQGQLRFLRGRQQRAFKWRPRRLKLKRPYELLESPINPYKKHATSD